MQVLNIFHVLVAIAMVAFILVQRGPGATAGAAFGSGASGTVFGARGAGSFLSRSTWFLGTFFCLISMVMAVLVSRDLATPEVDLGVVGAPAAQETQAPPAQDLPGLENSNPDAPVLDPGALDDAAGDLPGLGSGGEDDAGEANEGGEAGSDG